MTKANNLASSLRRLADGVAAGLLAVIFVAFLIQILLRYAFNWPVGWTAELSVVAWLWLVLWGASFVLREDEEIRLDLLTASMGPRGRTAAGVVGSLGIVILFGMSLPAAFSYVSFMKVERSSYLNVRFDVLFSIYIVFSVAVIGRNMWRIVRMLQGKDPAGDQQPLPDSAS